MQVIPIAVTKMIAKQITLLHLVELFLFFGCGLNLASGQAVSVPPTRSPQTISPGPNFRADTPASSPIAPLQQLPDAATPDNYVISPEDTLSVYVFDVPELSRDYLVSSAGTITVPLLTKPVRAAGLTLNEFAHNLEESFREPGVLTNPQVSVSVHQSRRSVVSIEGAVKNPQAVPVFGRTSLRSVLDQCGGLAEDAGNTITVSREIGRSGETGSEASVVSVEVKRLRDMGDPMSRFEVGPGDRVSVEHAGLFYVLGEVNRPGGYNLKSAQEQVTVLQALAIAGDVTSVAKKDKTRIIRKDPKAPDGVVEVALNVKDIIAGHSPDPVLHTSDILYVPASGSKKVARTFTIGASQIIGSAGAAAIYARP